MAALLMMPLLLSGSANALAIAGGHYHNCTVTAAGGIVCWGANDAGQLGDGTTVNRAIPTNVQGIPFGAVALAGGWKHTCAVTGAGAVMCWGLNDQGEVGDGTTVSPRLTPTAVTGLGSNVSSIAAGGKDTGVGHSCALTNSGNVYCWGSNSNGQLGNGTFANQSAPAAVSGLTGAVAIAAGDIHSCAVTGGGGVKCWGANYFDQLGYTTVGDNQETPGDVTSLSSGVYAIAAGSDHTCALTSLGGVKCWGSNVQGALGDGSGIDFPGTVVDVAGLQSGVVSITAGSAHTCALTSTGAVKCWGYNSQGQLGDGTVTQRNTPVDVVAGGVVAIAAGQSTTCALTSVGVASCWGANPNGQLGSGVFGGSAFVPVPTVTLTATSVSLTSDLNPAVFGDSITFTATVTGGVNGAAISFQDLGLNIPGCASQPLASGTASCTTSALLGGTHSIAAIYPGTPNTLASSSSGLAQIVNKANQTIIFDALATKNDNDTPFAISASASSGLAVTFSSNTPADCAVAGNTVSLFAGGTGTCTIAANQAGNGNYNSAPQITQSFSVLTSGPPLTLISVVSRKTHGAAGTFDLPINPTIPINGAVDVEPRAIGGGHTIVFQFNNPVLSFGTVTSQDKDGNSIGAASAALSGTELRVTLTGIPDIKRVKVSVTNVNGVGLNVSCSAGFLVGDVNNSRSATSIDILQVKGRSGLAVNTSNYRYDLNINGSITSFDILQVKGRSGQVLP